MIDLLLFFYFTPTLVAWLLGQPRDLEIAGVNFLFGWTGVGWLYAMYLALMPKHTTS